MTVYHDVEQIFSGIPVDFHEERVLLLGRCHRHREALYICVHFLQNTGKAEDYCRRNYNADNPEDRDVSHFSFTVLYS